MYLTICCVRVDGLALRWCWFDANPLPLYEISIVHCVLGIFWSRGRRDRLRSSLSGAFSAICELVSSAWLFGGAFGGKRRGVRCRAALESNVCRNNL